MQYTGRTQAAGCSHLLLLHQHRLPLRKWQRLIVGQLRRLLLLLLLVVLLLLLLCLLLCLLLRLLLVLLLLW